MPDHHPFEESLRDAWPPPEWSGVTVVAAVSGGADSVALVRAMAQLAAAGPGQLVAAHFNHALRGHAADEDQAFVEQLCGQLGIDCIVGRVDRPLDQRAGGVGLESAARRARYAFLRQTAGRVGARFVVTAHTADDQIETILHRIIRGTGLAGLSGMARARRLGDACTLIRPLLAVRRADVVTYLDHLGQPYRTDASNRDTRLTRNRIRLKLLPRLAKQFNPRVGDALLRLGVLAAEAGAVIDRLVDELTSRCVADVGPDTVRIDAAALADQSRYVTREVLIAAWRGRGWPLGAMGFAEWDALAAMLRGEGPRKQVFPGAVTAEMASEGLLLRGPT